MPIYEYVCHACGDEFEALQGFSEAPLEACTVCGASGRVARKLSLSAFQLKGGGWYKEGYASGNGGNGASAAGGDGNGNGKSAGKEAGSDSGKSDSAASSKSGGESSTGNTGSSTASA